MSGASPSALAVRPFRIAVEAAAVEELRRRLRSRARPAAPFAAGKAEQAWAAGTDAHALEELCAYWESGFEWRGVEAELNAWPHFKAKVDDVDLHFIHVANATPGAIPLLLVHGWPGSVYEFHRLLPLLARDEAHPVSLVVPSLPGFGWSSIESGRGHSALSTAALLDKLMVGLGYAKYAVQGGDWGAVVVDTMAQQFPQRVCALHLNMPVAPPLPGLLSGRAWFHRAVAVRDLLVPSLALDAEDQHTVARLRDYVKNGSSYFLVQATRPGMVGPALNDSPVALLSWILEKFHAWTDRRGGPAPGLSRDQMLANVSIYWFTQTIESSMRFYLETVPLMPWVKDPWQERSYCSVPTAVAK
jgi:pimeloyl-ACP methyl ester carboxylesterase